MTELLISVRSLAEFKIASDAGVRFIDVKEPDRGSLGAASFDVLTSIVASAKAHHKISVAMGELLDDHSLAPDRLPPRTDFAKLGLAGCLDVIDWQDRLRLRLESLPQSVASVAVAYADWQDARSPRIEDVFAAGLELGCSAFLIDTFSKRHDTLLSHMTFPEIVRLIERGRRANQIVALAGSLDQNALRQLKPLDASLLAVRSAACRGDRTGHIDENAIRELCEICS